MTVALLSLVPLRASQRTMALKDFSLLTLGGQESPQRSRGPAHLRFLDGLSFKSHRKGPTLLWTEGGNWTQIFWRWVSCLS